MNLFSFSQERSGVALSNKIRNKTNPLQKLYLKTVKIAISCVSQYCESILCRFSLNLAHKTGWNNRTVRFLKVHYACYLKVNTYSICYLEEKRALLRAY